jgi:hypothetical protein
MTVSPGPDGVSLGKVVSRYPNQYRYLRAISKAVRGDDLPRTRVVPSFQPKDGYRRRPLSL